MFTPNCQNVFLGKGVIDLPPNSLASAALTYTLTELARRAGWCDDSTKLPIFYGPPDQFKADEFGIIVVPTLPEAWNKLLSLPPHSLTWLPAERVMPVGQPLPAESTIPVLFWGEGYEDGSKPFVERTQDGHVVFYADIIAATFFMLSRWEETAVSERDEHDRFSATASIAYKQGFLDRPIVDEYALILQAWLKVLLPCWKPRPHHFTVKLSHDIDHVWRFIHWESFLRTVGGDLLKRRKPTWAAQAIRQAFVEWLAPNQGVYLRGIQSLAEWSKQYELDSAFYFKAALLGRLDSGYDPASPPVKECIAGLREEGFEVGFHPGYDTFDNPARLAAEKVRLDQVLGVSKYGGRQHYLRFRVPDTWRHWEKLGLTYDSTLGYADHEGFRCGTCHPYRPFDIKQNREMNLQEVPLIVMDGTLKQARGLSPAASEKRILELAERCKRVGGVFTLLWHNSSLDRDWQPWAAMYREVLKKLAFLTSESSQ